MKKISWPFNKKLLVVVVILLTIGLFSGFTPMIIDQPTRPPTNTIVWEITGNPDSMDPAVDFERLGNWVLSNIYETLYTYPFNNSTTEPLVPLLAAGPPSISSDRKNYTIEVRQDITFHDGTPFNASCVKWSIERAMKIFSDTGVMWSLADVLRGGTHVKEAAVSNGTTSVEFRLAFEDWIANSSAIEILDTYTIMFVLERPFLPFVTLLATGAAYVMSPTYAISHATTQELGTWEAYGIEYGDWESYMHTHTCGTGPYILTIFVPDQYIELDFFMGYWRNPTSQLEILPPSYAGSITKIYLRINQDPVGRKLNLRTGVVDGVEWPQMDVLEIWDSNNDTSLDSNIHVSIGGYQFTTTFFGFNMGNLTVAVDSTTITAESPFRNNHFRRSASFAFNYSNFIDVGYYGLGVQARGPIPMGMSEHNGSSFTVDYNITAAVEEWNVAMQSPEFIASMNAINSSFTFYYIEGSSLRFLAMSFIQKGLEDVFSHPLANHTGLDHDMTITIEELLFADYKQYNTEGRLPLTIFDCVPKYADPISYLYPLCHSSGEMAQEIHYNNTDVDLWCEMAINETDSDQREVYFNQIQDTIADETPYLWAYQQIELRTWRNWTSGDGFIFNPMRDIYFYHIFKDYSMQPSQYYISGPSIFDAIFVLLLAYVVVNHFISPSILRLRLKSVVLVIYTGLNGYVTIIPLLTPFYYAQLPFLFIWGIQVFSILGLLWLPWFFLYSDYKQERKTLKQLPPSPLTIEL